MTFRLTTALALAFGIFAGTLCGQDSPATMLAAPRPGAGVRDVSLFGTYYSTTLPTSGGAQSTAATLPADFTGGGSIAFEWNRFTDTSAFSLHYTPSYVGRVRYSSVRSLNQAFSLNTTRQLPRWNVAFSVAGDYSSVEQFLFSPTSLGNVVAVPATFDDLASGFLSTRSTNPQLTSVLASAPLLESPVRPLLYGQRMFTASTRLSLAYSYSPRLFLTFVAGGNRSQNISEGRALSSADSYLIRDTTSGNAGVTLSYSLSPRTQIGASIATARVVSSRSDLYTTTSLFNLGRTFSRTWFLQLHGGVGSNNPVRQSSTRISTKPGPTAGGGLGFKRWDHTMLASFDRIVSDSYGLGSTSTYSVSGTWRWSHPGSDWWLEGNVSFQQLRGGVLAGSSGWNASGALGRAFGRHVVMVTQFTHLEYSAPQQPSSGSRSQEALRVSLVWSPQPNFRR